MRCICGRRHNRRICAKHEKRAAAQREAALTELDRAILAMRAIASETFAVVGREVLAAAAALERMAPLLASTVQHAAREQRRQQSGAIVGELAPRLLPAVNRKIARQTS